MMARRAAVLLPSSSMFGHTRMMTLVLFLLMIFTWAQTCLAIVSKDEVKSLQLHHDLFQNYSVYVPPRRDLTKPMNLSVAFVFTTLLSLDNLKQEMTSQVLLNLRWIDEFLTWSPENYDNISAVHLRAELIWLPFIRITNELEKSSIFSGVSNTAEVSNTGQVSMTVINTLNTRCSLDMTKFPFDKQICSFEFYPDVPLSLANISQWTSTTASDTNGEWLTESFPGTAIDVPFGGQRVVVHITLKRLSGYYIFNIVLPMVLLSGLCNVVFLVSAESGDKLNVALTLLLSEAVFLSYTSSLMPKTSDETPLLTVYLVSLLVINTMSILATLYVLKIFKNSEKTDIPSPSNVLINIKRVFGPLTKVTTPLNTPPMTLNDADRLTLDRRDTLNDRRTRSKIGDGDKLCWKRLAGFLSLGNFGREKTDVQNVSFQDKIAGRKCHKVNGTGPQPSLSRDHSVTISELTDTSHSLPGSTTEIIRPVSQTRELNNDSRSSTLQRTHLVREKTPVKVGESPVSQITDDSHFLETFGCIGTPRTTHIKNNISDGDASLRNNTISNTWVYSCGEKASKEADLDSVMKAFVRSDGKHDSLEPRMSSDLDSPSEGQEDVGREWRQISRALDRMFFLLFTILMGAISALFFLLMV